jgi:hypothetical protein
LVLVSFGELPITRFPNIDVPIVQVRITQVGAAPSELEVQVTKKVEDAIAGVNGIKHQTSAVTEGSSITTIEFRLEAIRIAPSTTSRMPSRGSAPSCRAPLMSRSSPASKSRACRS